MAEPNEPNTDPKAGPDVGAQQEPPKTEPQSAGGPDAKKAAEKYKAERDAARKETEELKQRIEKLEGNDAQIEQLKADLAKQKEEADAKLKKAERDRVNTSRLAKEGCIDTEVALTLLDENGDVDKLKEEKPYLFKEQQSGSTGKNSTSPSDHETRLKRARKAAGLE